MPTTARAGICAQYFASSRYTCFYRDAGNLWATLQPVSSDCLDTLAKHGYHPHRKSAASRLERELYFRPGDQSASSGASASTYRPAGLRLALAPGERNVLARQQVAPWGRFAFDRGRPSARGSLYRRAADIEVGISRSEAACSTAGASGPAKPSNVAKTKIVRRS